jgi:hypothetical protein
MGLRFQFNTKWRLELKSSVRLQREQQKVGSQNLDPIVVWASTRLFNSCIKKLDESPALDVSDIFPKLIQSLAIFSDSQIPHAIHVLSGGRWI